MNFFSIIRCDYKYLILKYKIINNGKHKILYL